MTNRSKDLGRIFDGASSHQNCKSENHQSNPKTTADDFFVAPMDHPAFAQDKDKSSLERN